MPVEKPESTEEGQRVQTFEGVLGGRPLKAVLFQPIGGGEVRLDLEAFEADFAISEIDELILVLQAAVARARTW